MRNPLLTVSLLLLLPVISGGCAYQVYVAGVPLQEPHEAFAEDVPMCISRDPDTPASDSDARLEEHIGRLLTQEGLRTVEPAEADYCVLFGYDIEAIMGTRRLQFIEGATGGMHTVTRQGPFKYSLSLRVVPGDAFRKGDTEESVWLGGAVISEAPTRSDTNLDVMLVALFEHFAGDTQGTVKTRMGRTDSRVRRLVKVQAPETS